MLFCIKIIIIKLLSNKLVVRTCMIAVSALHKLVSRKF